MADGYGMPKLDFSTLGDLGTHYNQGQRAAHEDRTLASLSKLLQSGKIDYNQAAGLFAQLGQFGPAMTSLQVGRSREAAAGVEPLLRDVLGGGAPRTDVRPPVVNTPVASNDPTMEISPRQVAMANGGSPAAMAPSPNGPGTTAPMYPAGPPDAPPATPAETVGQRFPQQAGQPFTAGQAPSPQAAAPQRPGPTPAAESLDPRALRLMIAASNPDLPDSQRQLIGKAMERFMPTDDQIVTDADGTIVAINKRTKQVTVLHQGNKVQYTRTGTDANGEPIFGYVNTSTQAPPVTHGATTTQANNPFHPGGKVSKEQADAGGYANRMLTAEGVFRQPQTIDAATSLYKNQASRVPIAGNYLVGTNYQEFDQAARNFINANLRRESGAVISDAEFENARQQYLPQPGDTPAKLQWKMQNRLDTIRGIAGGAGPTFTPKYLIDEGGSLVRNPKAPPDVATPGQQRPQNAGNAPPPAAVQALRGNPRLKEAFDQKYGKGAADRALAAP